MDKPTFALVENPIHPVLVLVNKVSIWGSFFPVGVLNYLICVVVPAVEVKRLLKIFLERKKHLTGLVSSGPSLFAWARWKVGPKLSP